MMQTVGEQFKERKPPAMKISTLKTVAMAKDQN
jgi:hypothetical protein